MSIEAMIDLALKAQENAYAPYSKFNVGVCLRSESGQLFAGCNVENVAYLGTHAETSAISAMITAGDKEIRELVIVGPGETICTPCGSCRQEIREFAQPETLVHMCGPEGIRKTMTLSELLPASFGPEIVALGTQQKSEK